MNTKSKATVATIGLGALVLSGGTLALWQDGAVLDNAEINTGHLAVAPGAKVVYDVSDLKLQGDETFSNSDDHVIDLASYSAVPGDSIRIVQPITVDLEGHNLAAKLDIFTDDGAKVAVADRVTDDYPATDGNEEFTVTAGKLVSAMNVAAAGADDAQEVAKTPPATGAYVFTAADDDTTFYAVYDVTFNLDDQVGGVVDSAAMEAVATVSGMNATLTQVRS